jgi:hypothetical protein
MKNLLVISFLFLTSATFGQSLKKKFLGTYSGTVPAYKIDIGSGVVDVAAAGLAIELTAEGVTQTLGKSVRKGTWRIDEAEKAYYVILLRLEGQIAEERIVLQKKSKEMVREGIFPQPDALLRKM